MKGPARLFPEGSCITRCPSSLFHPATSGSSAVAGDALFAVKEAKCFRKRSDQVKGFVVQPRRWIVERTIAWLNRCRRLAKDWENLNRNALAFLKLASIRLMLRKLCNPS